MTLAQLGKQLKQAHPEYDDIPDAELGRALQRKHPGFFDNATDEPDLDGATVPETPGTLRLQLQQLQQGLRRVVFIARGSKAKVRASDYGMKQLPLPSGLYVFNPAIIRPKEIMAAVENHELNEILGTVDAGYGAPPKEELQGEPQAVVARDESGETAHSALSDEAHLPETFDAARRLMPPNGSVTVEPPHVEIEHRLAPAQPAQRIGGRGGKWPKSSIRT